MADAACGLLSLADSTEDSESAVDSAVPKAVARSPVVARADCPKRCLGHGFSEAHAPCSGEPDCSVERTAIAADSEPRYPACGVRGADAEQRAPWGCCAVELQGRSLLPDLSPEAEPARAGAGQVRDVAHGADVEQAAALVGAAREGVELAAEHGEPGLQEHDAAQGQAGAPAPHDGRVCADFRACVRPLQRPSALQIILPR